MPNRGRILLADDDEHFSRPTAEFLRDAGYACDCVPDAVQAAEKLRAVPPEPYDLLIAGIRIPGNRKLELVRELPRLAPGMPVILVTGYPAMETAIDSANLCVAAYLVKPVKLDDLHGRVKQCVDYGRAFRTVCAIRERLASWRKDLRTMETWMGQAPDAASHSHVDVVLDLTFRNIVGALSDLKQMTEAAAGSPEGYGRDARAGSPSSLVQALQEAIEVMKKTKGAFKSRQIGQLRRKLEGVVDTWSEGDSKRAQQDADGGKSAEP